EQRLAADVGITRMLNHGSCSDFAQAFAFEPEAIDHALQRCSQHLHVAGFDVIRVLARKWGPDATDDCNLACWFHLLKALRCGSSEDEQLHRDDLYRGALLVERATDDRHDAAIRPRPRGRYSDDFAFDVDRV